MSENSTATASAADGEPNLFIAYTAILVMAFVPIYIGSFRSLHSAPTSDTMTHKDAYMFPIFGSCVLFGLYLLFKFLSKEYINYLLTAYFLLFGIGALIMTFSPVIGIFFPKSVNEKKYHVSFSFLSFIPYIPKEMLEISGTFVDFVAFLFSLVFCYWYLQGKHWVANNIFGFAFSLQAISLMNLGSYQVGCILLAGLFIYDIFWVFGTDVMVTVAKSFDAPVKLLFPKDIFADVYQFSMLGLGDIVIPGIFIALLLRFDKSLSKKKESFPKRFFHASCIAYILGLATTIFVMHNFQAAQPALLYLVPFCIGSSLIVGFSTGKLKELFKYDEESQGEKDKKKE